MSHSTEVVGNCTLYLGDCRDILPTLQDGEFNLVFTDPPYNVGKDYGEYKDNLPQEEYVQFMKSVIEECHRVTDHNIVFFVGGTLTELYFSLIPGSHLIVVHKRAVGPMADNYLLQYHSLFSTARPLRKTKDLWDNLRLPGEGYFFTEDRYEHPGMTGLAFTKMVIEVFAPKEGRVLDPFMGVGTTAVACAQSDRYFVGIEQNPKYIDTAILRLKEVKAQLRLPI